MLLSILAPTELISGFNRLRRLGRITGEEYHALKQRLATDLEHVVLIELSPQVRGRATACLEQAPLRASDAIHVASALEYGPDRFLTADRRQHEGAEAMGLESEFVG